MIATCRRKIRFEDWNESMGFRRRIQEKDEKVRIFSCYRKDEIDVVGQIDEFFHYSFLSAYDFSRDV